VPLRVRAFFFAFFEVIPMSGRKGGPIRDERKAKHMLQALNMGRAGIALLKQALGDA
jgi:hypothetical protein